MEDDSNYSKEHSDLVGVLADKDFGGTRFNESEDLKDDVIFYLII